MLTGRPPFDPALPLLALAESIVKKEPPSLRELRPGEFRKSWPKPSPQHGEELASAAFPARPGLPSRYLPFAPGRASATAERAAAITPARAACAS